MKVVSDELSEILVDEVVGPWIRQFAHSVHVLLGGYSQLPKPSLDVHGAPRS